MGTVEVGHNRGQQRGRMQRSPPRFFEGNLRAIRSLDEEKGQDDWPCCKIVATAPPARSGASVCFTEAQNRGALSQ